MDELGERGEQILEQARAARSPTSADRERVRRGLVARGLIGAAAGGAAAGATSTAAAATGATTTTGAGLAAKLFVVSGLVVAGVGGTLWGTGALDEEDPAPSPVATAPVIEEPWGEEGANEVAASDVHDSQEQEADAAPETAENGETEHTAAPEPMEDTAEARRAARRRSRAASAGAMPAPSASALAEDIALLRRAQAARRSDPTGALELVAEHRSRFPRSQLRAERTALYVLLLCDAGRTAAARRIAATFLRRAAPSPLRRSVQESCAGEVP